MCFFDTFFLFNKKYLIYAGMTVSIQTIFNILLFMWAWYLIDVYKEKLIVDIKNMGNIINYLSDYYFKFYNKKESGLISFYCCYIDSIYKYLFLLRRNFSALSHFNVLFFAFHGLVIYVLYWALLILDKHSRQVKIN